MTEAIANHIGAFAAYAHVWGFLLVFIFMTIESSFIPFPSEVVMIPAGFLAWRGELTTGNFTIDATLAIIAGTLGSLSGAYINYYLALKLGRAALYKYGKYFFLDPKTLQRAEELFREYGEVITFVCRLIPAIRQLISIPAGLAEMNLKRFTIFTGLGAGIWVVVLTAVGAWFGHLSGDMTYVEMVEKGKEMLSKHTVSIVIGAAVIFVGYVFIHKKIMHSKTGVPQTK